jgi:hypothetical protein
MTAHPLLVARVAIGAVDPDASATWIAVAHQVARKLGDAVAGAYFA